MRVQTTKQKESDRDRTKDERITTTKHTSITYKALLSRTCWASVLAAVLLDVEVGATQKAAALLFLSLPAVPRPPSLLLGAVRQLLSLPAVVRPVLHVPPLPRPAARFISRLARC